MCIRFNIVLSEIDFIQLFNGKQKGHEFFIIIHLLPKIKIVLKFNFKSLFYCVHKKINNVCKKNILK